MYPALMRGRKTAGPDGLRGSGSQHCGALLMRDDETECPDPSCHRPVLLLGRWWVRRELAGAIVH